MHRLTTQLGLVRKIQISIVINTRIRQFIKKIHVLRYKAQIFPKSCFVCDKFNRTGC